jgi:hypothetical protein
MRFEKIGFSVAIAALTGMTVLLHAQATGAAQAKEKSAQAVTHTRLICTWGGVCHTEVRPGPMPYVYRHGCRMNTHAGCLKWSPYAKGVDF